MSATTPDLILLNADIRTMDPLLPAPGRWR